MHSTGSTGTISSTLIRRVASGWMFVKNRIVAGRFVLLAVGMASSILLPLSLAQSSSQSTSPSAQGAKPAAATQPPPTSVPSRYRPNRVPKRALEYYSMVWGVDSLNVKWTESGEVIRFSYRVLDPEKAKVLNDKKNEPSLIDPQAGVKLVVPSLEKVGQLRQSSTPEAGKVYWMAFSNKGRLVKRGHQVDVVIGTFRGEGLVVN
jgi:hypothetical protein